MRTLVSLATGGASISVRLGGRQLSGPKSDRKRSPARQAIVAASVLCASALSSGATKALAGDWPSAGRDVHNTRNAEDEHVLDSSRVAELKPLWTVTTDGNVTATPAVVDGVIYAPDFGGSLWAVDAATGKVVWKNSISSYTGVPGDVSRTTPAHWHGALIMGDGAQTVSAQEGATVFALDAKSGRPKWRTKVEADPSAVITGAPVVDSGVVYVGAASKAETQDRPATFRGSVLALSADTGKILWQTYLTKEGYTGAGVWGSTPAVDHDTGLVYVATGNNYSVPAGVCRAPQRTNCTPSPADNYVDSIVALDVKTGRVVWAARTLTDDVSTSFNRADGPDYDFAQGPSLFTTMINGRPTTLLGAGQKSGVYWALNPATGEVVWKTEVGPGGGLGGMMWGSATDGKRIYVSISNAAHTPIAIASATGESQTTTGGFWAALDAATGAALWRTPDPQGAIDIGALTVAAGVVYAGSLAPQGENMYALDAATGAVKWAFASGGSVAGGSAVVDGAVYWGSGYKIGSVDGANNKLFAFGLMPE
jgi:polyvinyl alcohol dehydrogenase (cytochrome)